MERENGVDVDLVIDILSLVGPMDRSRLIRIYESTTNREVPRSTMWDCLIKLEVAGKITYAPESLDEMRKRRTHEGKRYLTGRPKTIFRLVI